MDEAEMADVDDATLQKRSDELDAVRDAALMKTRCVNVGCRM